VIDVTERKRAQEALRVVEEQLRARVAELDREHQRKDQFLAMLAHELRNPLAPIQNAAALLGLGTLDAGALEQIRGILERQVSQLTRLVDDLLDVSRINRGKIALHRVPTPLASILDLAVETTRPLFDQRGHRLDVAVPPGPLWVDADPTRLAQAIANLLNNAARYTEPGGHVMVSVDRESGGAAIRVRDDGIGIAPETLPQVFEMFVQGGDRPEHSREGLGIGLTLVRRLVEMHGGSVEARSEGLGRGAEFVVRLPLVPAADERPAVGAASGGRSSLRVLVVDDNVDAAETLGALLRALDHQVRVVFDGRAALDAARQHAPHVTFLDLGMPGMSGYDVAKALRGQSETAGTWLVALTGWGEAAARRRTQEAGFDEHLVKPPQLDRLRAVLARAAPSSRAVAAPAPAGPLTRR
jgi:CheY-like chemotaxis protein/nitrogen-specific signal transduction histidine kinase